MCDVIATFCSESLAADGALERPLASVSAHVDLQRAATRERLVTHLAHVT